MVPAVVLIFNIQLALNVLEITMTCICWGGVSEKPAAHTQQNLTQVPPPRGGDVGLIFAPFTELQVKKFDLDLKHMKPAAIMLPRLHDASKQRVEIEFVVKKLS